MVKMVLTASKREPVSINFQKMAYKLVYVIFL